MIRSAIVTSCASLFVAAASLSWTAAAAASELEWTAEAVASLEAELVAMHGEEQRHRIQRGLDQVADFWRVEDGDQEQFEAFARRYFAGDEAALDVMFTRFEKLLEQLDGHSLEILLAFREQSDLDLGPIMPYDEIFAAYDPFAHINDDFFANKLAFTVLLNFRLTTLAERAAEDPLAREIIESQAAYIKKARAWTQISDQAYLNSIAN